MHLDRPALFEQVLGAAAWTSVSCARLESATLATIEQGDTGGEKGFVFCLKYDAESRVGLYAYNGDDNKIVTILAAKRVVIADTPTYTNNYELYIDSGTIKITNIASGVMTYKVKVF